MLGDIILKLAEVNEYNTVNMLNVLANIDKMEEKYYIPLVGMMVGFLDRLDPDHTPSVYNRIRKILLNTPKAVKSYEAVNGKINLG